MREDAKNTIKNLCGASESDTLVFTGSKSHIAVKIICQCLIRLINEISPKQSREISEQFTQTKELF